MFWFYVYFGKFKFYLSYGKLIGYIYYLIYICIDVRVKLVSDFKV